MIRPYKDTDFVAVCDFLRVWAKDHPELARGDILKWQKCDRWVAEHDGRVVGYLAQIPHKYLYRDGGWERIGWGVTIVIDMSDDEVRKKAGRALLDKAESNHPYGAVGVVDGIKGPYARRGHALHYDWCNMYARFLKPRRPLNYISRSLLLTPAIHFVNLLTRYTNHNGTCAYSYNPASLDQIIPDDATIDTMLRDRYPLYSQRTHDFIKYKIDQPNKIYHIYGEKNGYVIFREAVNYIKGLYAVRICDVAAKDQQTMIHLLGHVVHWAERAGAEAVIAIDSVKDRDIYECAGLWMRQPYLIVAPPHIKEPLRITMFDADLDNLW